MPVLDSFFDLPLRQNSGELPTSFLWGTHALRPIAHRNYLGWAYLETDIDGGKLFICTKEAGGTYAWTQAASPVTPPTTSAPSWVSVPASSTASGTPGQMAYDGTYLYWCYAPNSWNKAQAVPGPW